MKSLRVAILAILNSFSYAQHDTVIVRPVPINDVLQNPNMGITTFNRFNGQAPNPAAGVVRTRARRETPTGRQQA